jgi:hypothetical protein
MRDDVSKQRSIWSHIEFGSPNLQYFGFCRGGAEETEWNGSSNQRPCTIRVCRSYCTKVYITPFFVSTGLKSLCKVFCCCGTSGLAFLLFEAAHRGLVSCFFRTGLDENQVCMLCIQVLWSKPIRDSRCTSFCNQFHLFEAQFVEKCGNHFDDSAIDGEG